MLVWAGFDIAFGIIGMVMSFVIMALSVGLRVQPFGALAFPLLFAGLLSIVSASMVACRAGQECEIPNFKSSYLGRFPLVLADLWTSDHLSERSRSVDAFFGTRARAEHSR